MAPRSVRTKYSTRSDHCPARGRARRESGSCDGSLSTPPRWADGQRSSTLALRIVSKSQNPTTQDTTVACKGRTLSPMGTCRERVPCDCMPIRRSNCNQLWCVRPPSPGQGVGCSCPNLLQSFRLVNRTPIRKITLPPGPHLGDLLGQAAVRKHGHGARGRMILRIGPLLRVAIARLAWQLWASAPAPDTMRIYRSGRSVSGRGLRRGRLTKKDPNRPRETTQTSAVRDEPMMGP